MMGCRYGAKNTLDLGYLYLAEKHGARVFPETQVVSVRPLAGHSDGAAGYEVRTVNSTARIWRQPRRFTCRGVVFSASSLGTMELLFRLKENGSLPAISPQLGKHVRTNSESLIGVRMPGYREDLSQGIAIGSGIYIDEHTHIEAVRYPRGSDAMGLLTTILTNGRPGPRRIVLWLKNLINSLLRHPIRTVRVLQPLGWAREFLILLCMQALDGEIEMRWQRPWFWPFRRFLLSHGEKVPTYIPRANEFAQKLAELTGGVPMSMVPEILFNVPSTAHCIGGCVIADSSTHGVVDFPSSRFQLQEHVHLRRIGGGRQPRRQSEPNHYCACRTRHEFHPTRGGNGLERYWPGFLIRLGQVLRSSRRAASDPVTSVRNAATSGLCKAAHYIGA
jgi:cholesterol oxidase